MSACVFCQIVAGQSPATVVAEWSDAIAIVPLGPVTDGHVLIIPRAHVADAATDAGVTAAMFELAATYAEGQARPFNLITSAGREATQSIFHLHLHYVPRSAKDGLMVPWGTAWGENPQDPHRCRGMAALETRLAANNAEVARRAKAEAWDDGYCAGHVDARAVQPSYPEPTNNPYRAEEER